jgi:rubrerythrin
MEESHEKLITDDEILDLSLRMEREGQAFYSGLSRHLRDPVLKAFVQQMHKEEVQHEKLFKIMLGKKGNQLYGWEDKKELHDFIDEYFDNDIFPALENVIQDDSRFKDLEKAVDFAIEAEKVSAEFYSLLGDFCENMEAKTALLLLEKAERDHIKEVLAIKNKLLEQM